MLKTSPDDGKGFELEKSLFKMCNFYSLWKEGKPFSEENLNINDEKIVKHLDHENHWSRGEKIPTVFIEDFPNEKGYFFRELSINDDLHNKGYYLYS